MPMPGVVRRRAPARARERARRPRCRGARRGYSGSRIPNADRRMTVLPRNWREYGVEAAGAGIILMAACFLATMLGHPASPIAPHVAPAWVRRALMGGGMGLTIYALAH